MLEGLSLLSGENQEGSLREQIVKKVVDQGVAWLLLFFGVYVVWSAWPDYVAQQRQQQTEIRLQFSSDLKSISDTFKSAVESIKEDEERDERMLLNLLKSASVTRDEFAKAIDETKAGLTVPNPSAKNGQ